VKLFDAAELSKERLDAIQQKAWKLATYTTPKGMFAPGSTCHDPKLYETIFLAMLAQEIIGDTQ
jgi:hypothetical protein